MQDIITNDEIMSDTFNMKEVDGIVYEVECPKVKKGGETFSMSRPIPWPEGRSHPTWPDHPSGKGILFLLANSRFDMKTSAPIPQKKRRLKISKTEWN